MTLLKSGNDTVAVIPYKQIKNINSQLNVSRKNKKEIRALRKKIAKEKWQIDTLFIYIAKQDSFIHFQDSIIKLRNSQINRNHYTFLSQERQIKKLKKENKHYKHGLLGMGGLTIILSILLLL